jgi:cytosine/adenosine deaminase-related metal-dependent hydrolase
MLAAGINVAVGTDSCASSPNLNLLDDLRLLHTIAPELSALTLFEMATVRGAQAVQMPEDLGSISVAKRADLLAFNVKTDDPLTEILETPELTPAHMWLDGVQIY